MASAYAVATIIFLTVAYRTVGEDLRSTLQGLSVSLKAKPSKDAYMEGPIRTKV
jgi:hypothetical protein